MAFTEQGVAMLSSVLRSERAIDVNIAIMRAFVQFRKIIGSHGKIDKKLKELEHRLEDHDEKLEAVFEVIRELITPSEKTKKRIGFTVKEKQAAYRRKRKKRQAEI
jgi:hypothetical protein